jgi:kynurenine formamidase
MIDLSHPFRLGMPQSPNHPPFRLAMERRHGDVMRADGGSAANELIVLGGHVGTHVDALGHVSQDGHLHGGVDARQASTNLGLTALGIEHFVPFVGRGVVLDVAAVHGVQTLPGGYEITVDDLIAAQDRAGVELQPDDALLLGTGWSHHWGDATTFVGLERGTPGPGPEAALWMAARRPRLVGAETVAFECIRPGTRHALLPVHRILLVEHAINIVETLNLAELLAVGVAEFALVLAPLKVVGATGAAARPIALLQERPEENNG